MVNGKEKQKIVDEFEDVLKEKAIDCKLFYQIIIKEKNKLNVNKFLS